MATQPDAQLQQRLNESFEAFRSSLQTMLTAEARRHVDATLANLGRQDGPFRVEDIEVDVVIRDLKLTTSGAAPAERGARGSGAGTGTGRGRGGRRAAANGGAPRKRRRSVGNVRQGLLGAFADDAGELNTSQLREALERQGVKTSTDNVHQQLRRLVQAGDLERTGRGLYRRTETAEAAAAAEPAETV